MARAFIGVGSNIEPEENLRKAVRLLGDAARIAAISTVYLTEPEGRPEQPAFYNAVVEIETEMPPEALKRDVLRPIEEALGRRRSDDRYAPRTVDLDLLIYDEAAFETPELVIPDPQIAQRAFLAVPLEELAPDLVLPGSGVPVREAAASFAGHTMKALPGYTERLRKEAAHG